MVIKKKSIKKLRYKRCSTVNKKRNLKEKKTLFQMKVLEMPVETECSRTSTNKSENSSDDSIEVNPIKIANTIFRRESNITGDSTISTCVTDEIAKNNICTDLKKDYSTTETSSKSETGECSYLAMTTSSTSDDKKYSVRSYIPRKLKEIKISAEENPTRAIEKKKTGTNLQSLDKKKPFCIEDMNISSGSVQIIPPKIEGTIEGLGIGDYRVLKAIGGGSSGRVVLAYNKKTHRKVAIKIIKKTKKSEDEDILSESRIYREAIMSSLLDHPHITRLQEFLYSKAHFFLVFEYVDGQSLYDIIASRGKLPEENARRYFRQMVSAIDYMHKNHIVHRDLKMENIIIDKKEDVKIIDFGLSNFYDNRSRLKTFCGSLYFSSPEIIRGKEYCGPEIDIWSLGVILYTMVCGRVPFDDDNIANLHDKIKKMPLYITEKLSTQLYNLLHLILEKDASKRITLRDITKNEWVCHGCIYSIPDYMLVRLPIETLNEDYAEALGNALKFQFPSYQKDLQEIVNMKRNGFSQMELSYWGHQSTISLYYLLVEEHSRHSNHSDYRSILLGENELERDELLPLGLSSDILTQEVYVHKFVKFLFSGESEGLEKSSEEKQSCPGECRGNRKYIYPIVNKSYKKGFFNGISVNSINDIFLLRQWIVDIFTRKDISYEITEKYFFCSYYDGNEESYFRMKICYNIVLSKLYISIKPLNRTDSAYKTIYSQIREELSRHKTIRYEYLTPTCCTT